MLECKVRGKGRWTKPSFKNSSNKQDESCGWVTKYMSFSPPCHFTDQMTLPYQWMSNFCRKVTILKCKREEQITDPQPLFTLWFGENIPKAWKMAKPDCWFWSSPTSQASQKLSVKVLSMIDFHNEDETLAWRMKDLLPQIQWIMKWSE